jgi:hypothetical protein
MTKLISQIEIELKKQYKIFSDANKNLSKLRAIPMNNATKTQGLLFSKSIKDFEKADKTISILESTKRQLNNLNN